MISARSACGLDRLGLEQPAHHDPASVLSRLCIRPAELIGDAFAIATQADVIDPAKSIKVFGSDWGGHGGASMLSAGNILSVRVYLTAAPYRLPVKHL
jgi:hypothetical protein